MHINARLYCNACDTVKVLHFFSRQHYNVSVFSRARQKKKHFRRQKQQAVQHCKAFRRTE